jgi:WD40 repeat protein
VLKLDIGYGEKDYLLTQNLETVKVWDISEREVVRTLPYTGISWFKKAFALKLDIGYGEKGYLFINLEYNVVMWDISESKVLKTFSIPDDYFQSSLLSLYVSTLDIGYGEKPYLFTCTSDRKKYTLETVLSVKIWDISTEESEPKPVRTFINTSNFASMFVSTLDIGDGNKPYLFTGSDKNINNTVKMWDISTKQLKLVHTFGGHRIDSKVFSVIVSGNYLFTSSYSGDVKIWYILTGEVMYTFNPKKNWSNLYLSGEYMFIGYENGAKMLNYTKYITFTITSE